MIISIFLPLGSGYMRGGLGCWDVLLVWPIQQAPCAHSMARWWHSTVDTPSSLWEAWHQAHALVTEASCDEEGSGGAGEPCENWIYRGDGGLFPC